MDTKEMKEGHAECGNCGHGMGGGCYGHRRVGRIIVSILATIFIFWAGVQFGELKGMLHSGYGYRMMGAYGDSAGQNYVYGTPGGMMGGWLRAEVSTTTAR